MIKAKGSDIESVKISYDTYRQYIDLLQQTSKQRANSNYFFIALNTMVLIFDIFLTTISIQYQQFFLILLLSIIGIALCIYWLNEIRELHITEEVRYRILMEIERRFFKEGILNKEWRRLGEYSFKRSPVIFIRMGRLLPLLYIVGYFIQIFLFIYLYLFIY